MKKAAKDVYRYSYNLKTYKKEYYIVYAHTQMWSIKTWMKRKHSKLWRLVTLEKQNIETEKEVKTATCHPGYGVVVMLFSIPFYILKYFKKD